MLKRALSLLFILSLLFSFTSCGDEEAPPMLSHCELRLPLPDGYTEVENDVYDAAVSNGLYMIALTRISFIAGMMGDGIPETLTDIEFGELYLEKCSRDEEVKRDTVAYAEYFDKSGAAEYYYVEAFYRSQYAYFVILFVSPAELAGEAEGVFLELANKVYFTA